MNMKKYEMAGYTLYLLPKSKFKTFTVGSYFIRPMKEEGIIESAILTSMLMKYNQEYPSEKILSQYLESLYGMSLYSNQTRQGLTSSINVVINSINDKFLDSNNENLLRKSVNLLITAVSKPYFNEDLFNIEKELLIEDIERVYNNKQQYATLKFIENIYENERCRHSVLSSYDKSKTVKFEDVINEYNDYIKSKKIFYVIGDFEENEILEVFSDIKFDTENSFDLEFFDYETKIIKEVKEVIEEQKNKQSLVFMGYRSEIREKDPLYYGMFLLNNMLGGFFHSTLFQEIREKRSLAYSVSSEYNSKKGTFVIAAGISQEKYQLFKEIVSKIINDYQNGLIEDDTFELTKKLLISSQYKVADQLSYGLGNILNELSGIKTLTLEEKVEIIKNISKEDVVNAAKQLQLDTIYLLKGNL